jgi:hypothetical protein
MLDRIKKEVTYTCHSGLQKLLMLRERESWLGLGTIDDRANGIQWSRLARPPAVKNPITNAGWTETKQAGHSMFREKKWHSETNRSSSVPCSNLAWIKCIQIWDTNTATAVQCNLAARSQSARYTFFSSCSRLMFIDTYRSVHQTASTACVSQFTHSWLPYLFYKS